MIGIDFEFGLWLDAVWYELLLPIIQIPKCMTNNLVLWHFFSNFITKIWKSVMCFFSNRFNYRWDRQCCPCCFHSYLDLALIIQPFSFFCRIFSKRKTHKWFGLALDLGCQRQPHRQIPNTNHKLLCRYIDK